MTEAVAAALISGLCVAVPSVITTMFSNNKANTLMNYRIDELAKAAGRLIQKEIQSLTR